jgi:hypothetical protein
MNIQQIVYERYFPPPAATPDRIGTSGYFHHTIPKGYKGEPLLKDTLLPCLPFV